jgi:hypothetical protein
VRLLVVWPALLFLAAGLHAQQLITISNSKPRLDETGKFVDAHDGRVIQFGNRFYWYGTQCGNTSGFTTANRYVCYSSPDMMSWRFKGALLADAPEGVYYRKHVIYNAQTRKYVMWYNWYPVLWQDRFGVAESERPEGPFRIVNSDVKVKNSGIGVGDFGLFVDDDGTAYLAYNTIHEHQVSIEKLTRDFLSFTMENGGVIAKYCEAGSMFKRQGRYYLLTDYTCCFCGEGSGARVYISDKPLSGYQMIGNINRLPGVPLPHLTDGAFDQFQVTEMKPNDKLLLQLNGLQVDEIVIE